MTETSTYKSADFNSTQLEIDNFPHELSIQTHGKSDLVSNMILKDKLWEAYETQLMIKHLKLGNNVLDIGGNIGYYTLIASKLIGEQGKVFTFEPEPQNFRLLKENIKRNNIANATLYSLGLGNKKESIQFYTCSENRGDHRAFNNDNNRQETVINIISGDEVIKGQKIDFIKIDTQGFELAILEGLRNTINNNINNKNHLKMIVEFWPFALEENNTSANVLLNEIEQYDFKIRIIDHINHCLIDTTIDDLKTLVKTDLTPSSQGFINLWVCKE
jgi:FkbM family methyltransferase